MSRFWTFFLAIILTSGCASFAQVAPDTSVSGVVTDPSGAVIPDAAVTLRSGGAPSEKTTDEKGTFRFSGVSAGSYQLTATSHGFRPSIQTISVEAGETLHLRISLQIDVQQQQVKVGDDTLDSSPDHNQGAILLKGTSLAALATDPMQLRLQLQALAGSGSGTQFYIDGFTAGHLPPKSAIQEIRINDNPFSAQWDATGLGRVEVVTKPGADALHGTLSLLGEDSNLNSQNPFVSEQPPYSAFYSEGNISGKLGAHSSWLFDGDEQNVGAQSFIHTVTSPAGPAYTATVSSPRSSVDVGPRFDFQLGKVQTISLRYQFGRQQQDNLVQNQSSLQSQAVNTRHTEQTFQFSDAQVYSPRFINETRFQFQRTNDSTVSLNGGASILVEGAFDGGGNFTGQLHDGQNHYELQNYSSLGLGDHLLRFGARLRDVQDGNSSTAGFNGQFIFSSIEAYQATQQGLAAGIPIGTLQSQGLGPSQFAITAGEPKLSVNVADVGAYFEDQWKLSSNMTLTPGLRFESQTNIPDHADFAPRLAYAWGIGGGKDRSPFAVLRAGIGVFYDRFAPNLVLNAERQNGVLQQQYVVNAPEFYPSVPPVDQLGPATLPTVYRISPRLSAPHVVQETFGIDKDFFKNLTLSVDYTFYRGIDQLLTRNINAPLPGTYDPANPESGTRPLGTQQNIYEYESEGTTKRGRIYAKFRLTTKPLTLFGYYTYGHSHANTSGASSFPSNQYDLHQDYGRASNDNRNRFYVGGVGHLPLGIEFYPFLVLESNLPFNIVTGTDLNGDSQFNDRPAFATDLNRSSVYRTKWGNFDADPLPGQKIIPINYGKGPSVEMLNMSLTKNIGVGPKVPADTPGGQATRKYLLNVGMEGQNILNTINGGTPLGVLGSPLFGQSTSLTSTQFSSQEANRILYLTMRFDF
ncbi:carboxypeptidase regulatory-like domain-containing protein [Silvibacterium acidisoli]|uniref:carboxypeptidase regulatory-like domain-containing protein n=1 Tax=Acidobacteriaceae bacterium ZG23-2 TaxID=2883246 RepID=UPI00406C755D